jgi:hypothetical protein
MLFFYDSCRYFVIFDADASQHSRCKTHVHGQHSNISRSAAEVDEKLAASYIASAAPAKKFMLSICIEFG